MTQMFFVIITCSVNAQPQQPVDEAGSKDVIFAVPKEHTGESRGFNFPYLRDESQDIAKHHYPGQAIEAASQFSAIDAFGCRVARSPSH